jgi:hypothetical protein
VDGLKALQLVHKEPTKYRFGRANTLTISFEGGKDIALPQIFAITERTLDLIAHRG